MEFFYNGIDVCLIENSEVNQNDYILLSAEEIEKAKRIKHDKERNLYLISHIELRKKISKRLMIPASEISFSRNLYGKPYLEDYPNLSFNLSHSGEFALFCLSEQTVGADIQRIDSSFSHHDLIPIVLGDKEKKYCQDLFTFIEIWTKKEALLKGIGTGVHDNIRDIDVVSLDKEYLDWEFLPLFFESNNTFYYGHVAYKAIN